MLDEITGGCSHVIKEGIHAENSVYCLVFGVCVCVSYAVVGLRPVQETRRIRCGSSCVVPPSSTRKTSRGALSDTCKKNKSLFLVCLTLLVWVHSIEKLTQTNSMLQEKNRELENLAQKQQGNYCYVSPL
jgi:hypothetical protein